eukprot:SM000314S12194  [mRNA]  locus=s314:44911:47893:- [translate_table: standard]
MYSSVPFWHFRHVAEVLLQSKANEASAEKRRRPAAMQGNARLHAKLAVPASDSEADRFPTDVDEVDHSSAEREKRILLVGEGDFSFSLALAWLIGSGSGLVATTLDLEDKYSSGRNIVDDLRATGATVLFGVDANRLGQCLHLLGTTGKRKRKQGTRCVTDEPFDRIVFNFPHVGCGIKDQDVNVWKNKVLVFNFFLSAVPLLHRDGRLHLAIKNGKPYRLWHVTDLALQTGRLQLLSSYPFKASSFPGWKELRFSEQPAPLALLVAYAWRECNSRGAGAILRPHATAWGEVLGDAAWKEAAWSQCLAVATKSIGIGRGCCYAGLAER